MAAYPFMKKIVSVLLAAFVAGNAQTQQVYDTIMARLVADLHQEYAPKTLLRNTLQYASSMEGDGSWKDIDYTNPDFDHLQRATAFALSFSEPATPLYKKEYIYEKIVTSMRFWVAQNPKHRNWWFNDIFYPQQTGRLLLVMRASPKQLPAGLEDTLINRMVRRLKPNDGANTSDEALHFLYRACLTKNKATMDSAAYYLYEPVRVAANGGEGLQPDNSYYQHGKQQAIASYGKVFVSNSINAAYILRKTSYAMPPGKQQLLINFFCDTYLKSIRGRFYDFNVRGRGISRKDSLMGSMAFMARKLAELTGTDRNLLQTAAQRMSGSMAAGSGIQPAHRYFWKGHYTQHIRQQYSFTVQTNSTRTLRTERGNNENLLGQYLPDGATNIQRTGSEYANIMPLWNWANIPGTTSRQYMHDSSLIIQKEWGIPGNNSFAGGISDSTYGVTAYAMQYDSVHANKSWFFFDTEIVCLGAGISSNSPENIATTVNQCWQRGDHQTFNKKDRVWHDSIGYFMLDNNTITAIAETRSGSWFRINKSQSEGIVQGKVFKAVIDHGSNPSMAGYAYLVRPAFSAKDAESYEPANDIVVISNTANLQAIYHKKLDMLQAVLFKPCKLNHNGTSITSDIPVILYIKNISGKEPVLYASDPNETAKQANLQIRFPGCKEQTMQVAFQQGANAGATTIIIIKK